ncbi:MAG: GntR family transcriptional regulator [Chitinivibrionales bacterium]|nr:GntR family transcriptional regulator [Chitinivibrionales bacterium]
MGEPWGPFRERIRERKRPNRPSYRYTCTIAPAAESASAPHCDFPHVVADSHALKAPALSERGCSPMDTDSALHVAQTYLRETMRLCRGRRRRRLPGLRAMARSAGVSAGTMRKALIAAAERGAIRIVPRSGAYLRGMEPQGTTPPLGERNSKAARVTARLRRDVFEGQFSRDTALPTSKELGARYGASYRTMAKAVAALEDEGVVVRQGRYVRIAPPATRGGRPKIVLIARGDRQGHFRFPSARSLQNLSHLEHECEGAGVRLVIVAGDPVHRTLTPQAGESLDSLLSAGASSGVLGFIVWVLAMEYPMVRLVLRRLAGAHKPVAVYDDVRLVTGHDLPGHHFRLIQAPAGYAAGRAAGRFLAALGHRTVVFLRSDSSSVIGERFDGVADAMASVGGQAHLVSAEPSRSADGGFAVVDIESAARELLENSTSSPALRELARLVAADPEDTRMQMLRSRERSRFAPILEQASARTEATAWVGQNDEMAIAALDFLSESGVEVPQAVSVLGFDDSPQALVRGLTSYNFGAMAGMHAVVNHVLRPGFPFRKRTGTPSVYRHEGLVIARRSTGPARERIRGS